MNTNLFTIQGHSITNANGIYRMRLTQHNPTEHANTRYAHPAPQAGEGVYGIWYGNGSRTTLEEVFVAKHSHAVWRFLKTAIFLQGKAFHHGIMVDPENDYLHGQSVEKFANHWETAVLQGIEGEGALFSI